jgi:hypothetical protein
MRKRFERHRFIVHSSALGLQNSDSALTQPSLKLVHRHRVRGCVLRELICQQIVNIFFAIAALCVLRVCSSIVLVTSTLQLHIRSCSLVN